MSLQDRMEQILKNIHLLFSESKPYDEDGTWRKSLSSWSS